MYYDNRNAASFNIKKNICAEADSPNLKIRTLSNGWSIIDNKNKYF